MSIEVRVGIQRYLYFEVGDTLYLPTTIFSLHISNDMLLLLTINIMSVKILIIGLNTCMYYPL